MIDRKNFFDCARALFGGTLSQPQVDGMNLILDHWEGTRPDGDIRWLAYMLATAKHETANTMQPIAEYGRGKGHPYGVPDPETGQTYYGRGLVQITWKTNYQTMSTMTGYDLVHQPDMALLPDVAVDILFIGMEQGVFTGEGLSKYFNATTEDWVNARRTVNGLDQAPKIAAYGQSFRVALSGPVA